MILFGFILMINAGMARSIMDESCYDSIRKIVKALCATALVFAAIVFMAESSGWMCLLYCVLGLITLAGSYLYSSNILYKWYSSDDTDQCNEVK